MKTKGVKSILRGRWRRLSAFHRDSIKITSAIVILFLIIILAKYFAYPIIVAWRRDATIKQAQEFAGRNDYRQALLSLRRLTESHSGDLETWKMIADFLSRVESPQVLVAKKNVMMLAPQDLTLRLSYVLEALRYGQVENARSALMEVSHNEQRDINFHEMAAAVMLALGRTQEVEEHLAEVIKSKPDDLNARLDLANLQIWSADMMVSLEAQKQLAQLAVQPETRVRACLAMLMYAARTGDQNVAARQVEGLASIMVGRPLTPDERNAAPGEPPGWLVLLDQLKVAAKSSAGDATSLANWFAAIGMRKEALAWVDTLGETVRSNPILQNAETEIALKANDTERARRLLLSGAWGGLDVMTLDLAFASHWQRKEGSSSRADATWTDALRMAKNQSGRLRALTRLAAVWQDAVAYAMSLKEITQNHPEESWAFTALQTYYLRENQTESLWRLYQRRQATFPDDLVAQRTAYMLTLLLGRQDGATHIGIQKALEIHPDDPALLLCRAVSLHVQGDNETALQVIDGMAGNVRSLDRIKLWKGIIFLDMDLRDQAELTLKTIGDNSFLPEESRLLAESLKRIELLKRQELRSRTEGNPPAAAPSEDEQIKDRDPAPEKTSR